MLEANWKGREFSISRLLEDKGCLGRLGISELVAGKMVPGIVVPKVGLLSEVLFLIS